MPDYQIVFTRSARKELERLDSPLVERLLDKIEALASNPYPHDSRKLQTSKRLWRIRVGNYRIIYDIDDSCLVVDIVAIRHRKDAYRKMP